MTKLFDRIQDTARFLAKRWSGSPKVGIILGTGLNRLVNEMDVRCEIAYDDIPDFPIATVEAHAGKLQMGQLSGKDAIIMQGRFHYYEGHSMDDIVFPIRVMSAMGVETLIVSNAAGGLNPLFPPGTIMNIVDHINLLPNNPLIGRNDDRIGPRFPDMADAYSAELVELTGNLAVGLQVPLTRGIYAAMTGPSLETKAEYRMLRILGADAIGMSTIPEVIAAVHCGLRVLGFSVITDACLPDALQPVELRQIIANANKAEPNLVKLIKKVVEKL